MSSTIQTLLRDEDLVLWHEYRKGTYLDLTGNGLDGQPQNDPYLNRDGVELNGVDQNILVSNDASINFGDGTTDSPFSLVWYGSINEAAGIAHYLLSKNPATVVAQYAVWLSNSEKIRFRLYDLSTGGYLDVYTGSLNIGDKQCFIMTYDGSGSITGMNVYVDGLAEALSDGSGGSYTAMESDSEDFSVGRAVGYTREGVSTVMIIKKELSATEAADLTSEIINKTF